MKVLHIFLFTVFTLTLNGKSIHSDTPDDPFILVHDKQYFVKVDSLTPRSVINQLLQDMNSIEVWEEKDLSLAVWEVVSFPFTAPDGTVILDIDNVITTARKRTQIESVTFNILQVANFEADSSQNSGCFDISDYYMLQGDESTVISILDTGISSIADNSTAEYNYNLSEYTGYDYVNNDPIPDDQHGHGTHIAGLIHSITHQSNPSDPEIKFDIRKTHDSDGSAYMSSVVFAILDAIDDGADIINMSFSGQVDYDENLFFPLIAAIKEAEDEGTLIVAAAGNTSIDNDVLSLTSIPAALSRPNIVAVASHDCLNKLSTFSNYGKTSVDALVLGERIPGPDLNSGISYLSGTSQATAIVSALLALKGSHHIEDFFYDDVICELIQSNIHKTRFADLVVSDGYLNVENFLSLNTVCNLSDVCEENDEISTHLTGAANHNLMTETNGEIISSQNISSSIDVSYDSSISVELMSGFSISSGARFSILISGCD